MTIHHIDIDNRNVRRLIRNNEIAFAGNISLRIYGKLDCWSGKRMKAKNRIFFTLEIEAVSMGFRPCGHCMKKKHHDRTER